MQQTLFKGKFSTPFGEQWRSVKAISKESATIMLKNKMPYWKGWSLKEVVAS